MKYSEARKHAKPLFPRMTDEAVEWCLMTVNGAGSIVAQHAAATLREEGIVWEGLPEGVRWRRTK